jgi:hypothetical protein
MTKWSHPVSFYALNTQKNAHLAGRDERFFDSLKSFGSPAAHESGSVALRHQVSLVLPLSKTFLIN